jgi:hypothetical protein
MRQSLPYWATMADLGETPTMNLLYPHEGIDIMRENAQIRNAAYELGQFAHFIGLQTLHIETLDSRSRAFAVANGEQGSDIFPSKQRFSELINTLGYHAPKSITVEPGEPTYALFKQVTALSEDSDQRFCKPANGARGRGARMVESPADALAYAAEQDEAYLVQSFEKPERDWRYILHRDSKQLASGEPAGWHVMFKVERPIVVGDGNRPIADLLADSGKIPGSAKRKYIQHHEMESLIIPTDGEVVELLQTGNREQGAYRVPHSNVEEANLDRFMAQFVHDLEGALDTTLGTVCVDMGVKDSRALQGEYDFDSIRQMVVFYEHQLPFGMKPYLKGIPEGTAWGAADKLVPSSRRREYIEGQVYMNFVRSVIRSGRYLRAQRH